MTRPALAGSHLSCTAAPQSGCAVGQGCRAVLAGAASLLHVDFEAPVAKEEAWKASTRRGRSLAHKTAGLAQPPGTNGRLLPLQTLCLACSHVSSSSLLLVRS